jgi:hypothetical protein
MSKISRRILVCALTMIFLNSACGTLDGASPTPVGTILSEGSGQSPTATLSGPVSVTATGISITPLIPITGENVVSMQCQFCVDGETHAVLVFPDFAYFDVIASSPVSCLTADVVNGRRILICRGAEQTSFNLNICSDSSNCLQFPVALQACPLLQAGTPLVTFTPFAPYFLTPINTLNPPDRDPTQPTSTPVPSVPSPTSTQFIVPATPTLLPPIATTVPPPTLEPLPTDPLPTIAETDSDGNSAKPTKKPSKTPRPTRQS